ncbi:hypothetical protein BY458DRAFT_423506, partial [Sporodiniella umbellata]
RSMLSTSSGETDKDLFTFSSLSNYTNMTIDEEENVSDLNRQIEELQNQFSAKQDYTASIQHLLEIQTTQDELVNVLEDRYAQIQNQYTKTSSQATQGEDEETEDIQTEQANFLRAQRDRFYHQWKQQTQQSEKAQKALEQEIQHSKMLNRKIKDLESNLEISQELLKQQDTSGRIHKLEVEIDKVRQYNRREQEAFEKSQRGSQNEIHSLKQTLSQQTDTIRSLQSTTRILHQQLSN